MKTAASIFGVSAMTLSALAGSPNLLLNGSFEVPGNPLLGAGEFMDWDTFGNVEQTPFQDGPTDFAPMPFDGMFSAKMFSNSPGPGEQADSGAFQIVPLGSDVGGQCFRVTLTTQTVSEDPIFPFDEDGDPTMNRGHLPLILMQFMDANENVIQQIETRGFQFDTDASNDPDDGFDTWVTKTLDGQAPAGTENINVFCLFISFGDDPGALFWDSVSLETYTDGCDEVICPEPEVTVGDSTAPWEGFMNVSELPANGGGFVFGSGWGVADLTASFDDGVPSVTMGPVQVNDPNEFWYQGSGNPGGPGVPGNKSMESNLFQSETACFAGQTVTFSGFVHENSLIEGYEASIFIKDFEAGFGSNEEVRIPATPGPFSLTLDAIDDPTRTIQYGFTMVGPNVWPGDQGPVGTVTYSSVELSGGGCNLADIAEPFGILDLGDIGAFVGGFTSMDPIADLAAPFGIFDLGDIGAFVGEFSAGCP